MPSPIPTTATIIIILWLLSVCVVDLSDCATVPVRPVWPSQPARCFVLADVREHATCVMGASGNSDDITILKKSTIWALHLLLFSSGTTARVYCVFICVSYRLNWLNRILNVVVNFVYFPGIFIVRFIKLVGWAASSTANGDVVCCLLDLQGTSNSKECWRWLYGRSQSTWGRWTTSSTGYSMSDSDSSMIGWFHICSVCCRWHVGDDGHVWCMLNQHDCTHRWNVLLENA